MEYVALLAVLIFAAAILYSSVGHAGASGYLAAMALVGVAPDVMKPTALTLNILVATIATVRYHRVGGHAPHIRGIGSVHPRQLHSGTGREHLQRARPP